MGAGAGEGAGMRVATGTYTGDGNDNRGITGVGFQPEVVIVKGAGPGLGAATLVIRTDTMAGDLSRHGAAAVAANQIQSLDADGFTLGTAAEVNSSGNTFWWIALADGGQGDLVTGSYTGNGGSSRAISGLGIAPTMVWLVPASQDYPHYLTAAMVESRVPVTNAATDGW